MTMRALGILTILTVAATVGSGCASVKRFTSSPEDISVKQEKRTAEAVAAFEARRDFAQFQAAQARWREGNLSGCREAIEPILERNPKLYEARILLAEVLLSEEKLDAVRQHLELALSDRPDDARTQHMLGLVLEAQGHSDAALACYRRAAELEPQNEQYAQSCQVATVPQEEQTVGYLAPANMPEGRDGEVVSKLSFVETARPAATQVNDPPGVRQALDEAERAFAAGLTQKARSWLLSAVSNQPDDPQLPVRAAVLALRHAQPDIAVIVLQPAVTRFPDSAAIYRTLGTAYYRQADYTLAQRALVKALSLDNSSALAYLLMGCTLEKQGQSAAAKGQFDQARRLDPRL